MLAEMSTEQFFFWRAYYSLEPFGEKRQDLRIGTLASLIANVNRDPRKRSRPFSPEDFFTSLQDKKRKKVGARKPMSAEDWNLARKTLAVNYGG